jgi:cytoskeletal protein RodZ
MKRSSGNRVKELNGIAVPKPKKRASRWTLLFVGDRGKVIPVKRFKGLAITLTFAVFIVVALAVGLYFLYNSEAEENRSLVNALGVSRQQVRSLQDEKELLMVRLVLAESKIKAVQVETEEKTIEKKTDLSKDKTASAAIKPPAPDIKKVVETVKEVPAEKAAVITAVVEDEPDILEPSMPDAEPQMVSIEDLKVLNTLEDNKLKVTFKLRKSNQNLETISGHAFVVLKRDRDDRKQWFAIPSVSLVSGKPSRIRRGQYFSIARFKAMKFQHKYSGDPKRFQYVTVFIYGADKKLLLESEFPITVQKMPPEATEG